MPDLDATSHGDAGADGAAPELRALEERVNALQADVRRLERAPLPAEETAGWDDGQPPPRPASLGWISSLETPRRRPVRIPRLPLEIAFLVGAAALAGLAHLRPPVIAGVMAGAWVIVVLAEWAGSRGDRLRRRLLLDTSTAPPAREPETVRADPTWFTPPVEHTLIARPAPAEEPEQLTAVTRLPPPDGETTAERRPGA
jgi:hypothetical protein